MGRPNPETQITERGLPAGMVPSPASVVVADAKISGAAQAVSKAPQWIKLKVGQPLLVKLTYDLREASTRQESYQFRLAARCGDQVPAPVQMLRKDRPASTEEAFGFLVQQFSFSRPGKHTLEFDATAEYTRKKWFGKGIARAAKTASGSMQVVVN